jgi:hypothetical protein
MAKCKQCKKNFDQWNSLQKACSPECALKLTRVEAERRKRKDLKLRREVLKTANYHKKELESIFNKWVRLTDADQPCISCQRHHSGQYHAGHYRSKGSTPELRFEPDNVHKQCAPCNNHLSGNLISYRVNLVKKIGVERVAWIEGKHDPKKYTIEQIKQLKIEYKLKIKELERNIARALIDCPCPESKHQS